MSPLTPKQRERIVRRVLRLVDGYLSVMDQDTLHGYDGGMMTIAELRQHIKGALRLRSTPRRADRKRGKR